MRWTAPPERREIFIVFLSITAYLLAYNLETSLDYVGIDPAAAQGAFFRRIGLGKTKLLGLDGRKPPGWRDQLELAIFGPWAWDEGHIAGDGARRQRTKGTGRHGAQWVERKVARELDSTRFGNETVSDAVHWWMNDIPVANVVKHVPGFTILDNAIVHNGTVYLVTDDRSSLPPMRSIVETYGPGFGEWKVLSKTEGAKKLGSYGGFLTGVSWMSTDTQPSNTTLVDLWRMYSTLDQQIDAQGHTSLAPPVRLLFPHTRFFSDKNPPFLQHWIPRARAEIGVHPHLLKAAFPYMDLQFLQDWEDYCEMGVPFAIERLVISDRAAARKSLNKGEPANAPPFALDASRYWWEPIRRTMVAYFDRLDEEVKAEGNGEEDGFWSFRSKPKKVITYIDNHLDATTNGQSALIPGDYEYFSRALNKLGRDKGYEVHIISSNLNETRWDDKMDVIIRSTIVVGVHGNHLFGGVWMRPSPQATLMELFPEKAFSRDRELVMRSLGIKYMAWWTDQRFSGDDLPEATIESNQPVHINVDKIINEIHAVFSGK